MINIIREFINQWIQSLVVLIIIISIVDMVMPKGNMKRYVNFIVGLIIVFAMINPFIKLINLDTSTFQREITSFNKDEIYDDSLVEAQEDQIESIYLVSLETEIENVIEKNTDYVVENVNITTSGNREDNFLIDEILIKLNSKNSEDSNALNNDIKINKIKVGEVEKKEEYKDTVPEVEKLIVDHLQLEEAKIRISIEGEDKYGRIAEQD